MNVESKSRPDRISTYFLSEKAVLAVVTVSGLIYNIGLAFGPVFVGKMSQCLLDIFNGKNTFSDMLKAAGSYLAVIAIVQISRSFKRLYVRKFANHLNLRMKHIIYGNLVFREKSDFEHENVGALLTKAISDVETCAEGMRKFTTEVFDTGIAMISYFAMLLYYDWRLTLISMIFPPISFFFAEKMKTVVQKSNAAYKESSGVLSGATLDRVTGALTYRVFGCEKQRDNAYEAALNDYERTAIKANIWVSSMQPLYRVISYASVLFILWFGARNVLGTGWTSWNIAAFTAFLTCYTKLAGKSSHAAKLFNAVHKAQVSWKRIKPLMKEVPGQENIAAQKADSLITSDLGFSYQQSVPVFDHLNFEARTGEIIGITGPVACGKSTFGKVFLNEYPYSGSLKIDGREMSDIPREMQKCLVGYLGHDPEIMSASIYDNVALGNDIDVMKYLRAVCLDEDLKTMPEGIRTPVGSGGIRLSGGQQKRLALARTLAHYRPLLVLDDPFSALDRATELKIFENLKEFSKDRIIILISHRMYLFPEFDQVIWMENGECTVSDHQKLMQTNKTYAGLYNTQITEEVDSDAEK